MAIAINDYTQDLKDSLKYIKSARKDSQIYYKENDLLKVLELRYKMLYSQIHLFLSPQKNETAESEIRKLIGNIILYDLTIVKSKFIAFETLCRKAYAKKDEKNSLTYYAFMTKYENLLEKLFALAGFRSLEHFAQYMEWDTQDKDKVWKYSLDPYNDGGITGVNKPFFHYFTRMALKKDIKFISKQYPTGYGKCLKSDVTILTKNGYICIKDIKVGDFVASMKNNEIVYRKVTNKWNTRKTQIKITTSSGKEIITSPEHKLYTTNGYVSSSNLTTNDYLYRICTEFEKENNKQWENDKTHKKCIVEDFVWEGIKSIEHIDEITDMVDIEVEETHNFIANGIVSHNSFGNQIAVSWILGLDIQNDCLIVLGNPALVLTNTKGIVEIITNPRFANVFPNFQKYHDMGGDIKANIFSTCRIKEGDLTLADSTRPQSVKIISKQTSIDGIRVKFLFLDDVCRSKDANNLKMHEEDINNFWNSWYKRNYNTNDFYVVVGGTAYSVEDIISHLIRHYSKGRIYKTYNKQKAIGNKYTYTDEENKCIFIKIPKIDEEYNRSTYPQKFPYDEAIRLKELNPRSFMAMEQQQPQNPETTPLAYEKISTYKELPNGLSDCAMALIDPARSGKNYVAMPIFKTNEEIDKFGNKVEVHYFVDCIYELRKMEDLYESICEKIIKHNIVKFYIETNTDTSLPSLIEKMLSEKGYRNCKIITYYSTERKDNKLAEIVYSCENILQTQIKFPEYGLFAPSHAMGKFMQNVTNYDYQVKMEYDDGIESICEYAKREIKQNIKQNKAKLIYV